MTVAASSAVDTTPECLEGLKKTSNPSNDIRLQGRAEPSTPEFHHHDIPSAAILSPLQGYDIQMGRLLSDISN